MQITSRPVNRLISSDRAGCSDAALLGFWVVPAVEDVGIEKQPVARSVIDRKRE